MDFPCRISGCTTLLAWYADTIYYLLLPFNHKHLFMARVTVFDAERRKLDKYVLEIVGRLLLILFTL